MMMDKQAEDKQMKSPRKRRWGCLWLLGACLAAACAPLLWRGLVQWQYERRIYSVAAVPEKPVAIVFGAAVYPGGRLSSVLRDRMETAVQLYNAGKVQRIIVSGDNSVDHYNEPQAMMAYALQRGVPETAVQPDYAGLRTYDTCYRARHIFQVESAVLVTQEFHLSRALFTCQRLGVDAVGVAADLRPYRGADWYEMRETAATLVALWDVIRRQPAAIMGEPIPIE